MSTRHLISQAFTAAVVLLAAFTLNAADPVGEVVAIQGTMMVTQQDRYVITGGNHPIHVGDRVFMLEGGRAAIWYADRCEYFLFDDVVLEVAEESPCATGQGGEYRAEIAEIESAAEPLEGATEAAAPTEISATPMESVGERLAAARIEPSIVDATTGLEASPSVSTTTTSVAVTTGVSYSSWLPAALLGTAIGSAALMDFQGNIKTSDEETPISRIE